MSVRAWALFGLALCLTWPGAQVRAEPVVPEKLRAAVAKIDAMAAAEHAKDDLGSLTVGVVAGGGLVWTKSYGFADPEEKVPASADTVYRIGSITKMFTALMLLQLLHERKVGLSDPVEKYFPEIDKMPGRSSRITLEHLATMRSGLAREPANRASHDKGRVADWEAGLIGALPDTRQELAPGTRYLYSNIGYAILGAALSRAAGAPYLQHVHERILAPLKMERTAFEPNDAIRPRLAKGHDVSAAGRVSSLLATQQQEGRGFRVPNGAMYSTVGDLARFVAFELGEGPESVLSGKVLQDTFERFAWTSAREDSDYGIGMRIRRVGNLVAFGHGGNVPGYVASVWFDRVSKTGVIVLRSARGGRFDLNGLSLSALSELAQK